ncbi:MAG: hypothetical protein E7345_00145 [Clostridiales bacterium]|nr:hypothetical protein [Clostridiales bacterium]
MKEYNNSEYKSGKSNIKSFYTSNSVDSLGSSKVNKVKTVEETSNSVSSQRTTSYFSNHGFNVFNLIFLILISVSLIRILRGNSDDIVSFGSLLDLLQDAPVISDGVGTFVERLNITADWGIFNFLRNLFNDILGLWSILIWMGSSLVDVIVYIYYFLKWIFI